MKINLIHRVLRATGLLVLLGLSSLVGQAQPGSGGPQPITPVQTPIDGGASLLLAGGVALALKKLRRRPVK